MHVLHYTRAGSWSLVGYQIDFSGTLGPRPQVEGAGLDGHLGLDLMGGYTEETSE